MKKTLKMTSVVIVEYVMVSVCLMVCIQVFDFQNCIGKRVELDAGPVDVCFR